MRRTIERVLTRLAPWTLSAVGQLRGLRISRPCYDKMHRCPGWAGGGMRYAKVDRCDNGHLNSSKLYEGRGWKWRVNRCPTCGVVVLPYVVRYLDWRYYDYEIRKFTHNVRADWSEFINWDNDSDVDTSIRGNLAWAAVFALQWLTRTEWSENWRAWPHCCGQAGCWMHYEEAWCRCRCVWCRVARRYDRPSTRREDNDGERS